MTAALKYVGMRRAVVDDVELEYEVVGNGPPLLLIPGSNIASGMAPIARALADIGGLQVIRYHRRGMAGSTGAASPIAVERQAADALGLLNRLGIERADVCGYSYGGVVALEAALTAPASVRSLTLVEPILKSVPSADAFMRGMAPINERYATGDARGAIMRTFENLGGAGWRELVEGAAPGAVDQAFIDAAIFFEAEAPSLSQWSFDASRAERFSGHVLSIVARDSGPFFVEGRAQIHQWFPRCADADIPAATHMLNLQQPALVARALSRFVQSPPAR